MTKSDGQPLLARSTRAALRTPLLLLLFLLLLLVRLPLAANGARMLMFVPNLSYSHVAFNAKIADTLAGDGHNVTILLLDVDPTVSQNINTLAKIRRIDVGLRDGRLPTTLWRNPGPYEDASPITPRIAIKLSRVSRIFVNVCRSLLENTRLLSELAAERFEVGFAEQYLSCGFGLFRLIGVRRTFWLSATAIYRLQPETLGIRQPLSYVPELFSPFSTRMTFAERILNTLIAKATEFGSRQLTAARETEIFRSVRQSAQRRRPASPLHNCTFIISTELVESRPRQVLSDAGCLSFGRKRNPTTAINFRPQEIDDDNEDLLTLAGRSSATFANIMPLIDFPMPSTGAIRPVAMLTVAEPSEGRVPLGAEWRRVIDADSRRFIVVTFGSIARTADMPPAMLDALFSAFRHFREELNFFMKFEDADLSRLLVESTAAAAASTAAGESAGASALRRVADNVYVAGWMPQVDLIAHPKCAAIVTHGGWSGVLEALRHARPMVLMPLFADHFKDAKVIEHKRLGVLVDKHAICDGMFSDALAAVVGDESYSQNGEKYARMLHDYESRLVSPRQIIRHEVRRSMGRWSGGRAAAKYRQAPRIENVAEGAHLELVSLICFLVVALTWKR